MSRDNFYTLKMRRDTKSRWERLNPLLLLGEPALEKDTGRMKIGDGSHRWNDLEYFVPGVPGDTPNNVLANHIASDNPHPVYDDGPSLVLLYENAKV